MNTTVMDVKGMTCNHCVMSVSMALKALSGVANVKVDLGQGRVTIEHEGDDTRVPEFKAAIEDQGYEVV